MKTNRYLNLILLLVAFCGCVACSSSSKGDDDPVTPALSLSAASLSFDATGGESSVTVSASGTWTAVAETSASSWCTVSASGNNLAVKVTANTSASERTATVTVALTGASLYQTLKVTQAAASVSTFAKGADISWVTEMEKNGKKFYDSTGAETDCFTLMKNLGMNAIRLRVWVNPSNGFCGKDDVVAKAKRAQAEGLKLMIDFHYSDTWADPSKQTVPEAWKGKNYSELKTLVSDHTKEVLTALKNEQIDVEWVQVGNEITNGMLWDFGKLNWTGGSNWEADGWDKLAGFINAGYDAVKSVYSNAKVIAHVDNAYNQWHDGWYKRLKDQNVKFDMIGLSHYPQNVAYSDDQENKSKSATEINTMAADALKNLASTFNVPVMICEVGVQVYDPSTGYNILADFINKVKDLQGFAGIFYWEPESSKVDGSTKVGESYDYGAFSKEGKPTKIMDAFKN